MGRRRLGWALLAVGIVVGAACSSGDGDGDGDSGRGAGDDEGSPPGRAFVLPEPVAASPPTGLRVVAGPPAGDAPAGEHRVAALGTDEVVVGTWHELRLGDWYVGSTTGGTWDEIEPPPVGGEVEATLHTVGHDAVVVAKLCPDARNVDSEGFPACARGSEGVGVWRLDHRDRTWSEVARVPADELAPDDPDGDWWVLPVGVVGDAVYVDTFTGDHQTVRRITMAGEVDVAFEWDDWVERDTNIHTRCVTGSGHLVGEVRTAGSGASGSEMTATGTSTLAVRDPGADAWRFLDDVALTHQQPILCGADTVAIVGETDTSLDVGEWRTVSLDGTVAGTEPLPPEVLLGDSADYTFASFFRDENTHTTGEGGEAPTVVRDFGDVVNAPSDGGPDRPGLDHPRQVAVLPGPGLPPLVQDYPDAHPVTVHATTRLPDGRITTVTATEAAATRFDLLLAE